MDTSLVTFDGYPRADIDVAQIRTTRARIIPLRNDYKAIMNKIESGLHAYHAEQAANPNAAASSSSANAPSSNIVPIFEEEPSPPFAKVNTVEPDSPAQEAGLKVGDKIRNVGDVNWMNHERLAKVAQVIQRNEGRTVLVKILRPFANAPEDGVDVTLRLTPRRAWGGRGLLGCHLLPI
jgi:26S proteasome regulatory subunit N4